MSDEKATTERIRPRAVAVRFRCPECREEFGSEIAVAPTGPPVFSIPVLRCALCPTMPMLEYSSPVHAAPRSIIVPGISSRPLRVGKTNGRII